MNIAPPTGSPREISVTEPVSLALERVKVLLFRPFDLGKWFVIGFCAWLAGLGESGGGGFNYGNNNVFGNRSSRPWETVRHGYQAAHDYTVANLSWMVPAIVLAVLILLGLAVLFLWLNCRGKFMFLHCVALNRAEVAVPWDAYEGVANRLFGFRLVLIVAALASLLPMGVPLVMLVVRMFQRGEVSGPTLMAALALGTGMFLMVLLLVILRRFLIDFVVPLMYLRGGSCLGAWGEFLRLVSAHAGVFILYILFQIVLAMAIGVLVLLVVVATCCVAGCLILLPYVGTVALLPVLVFQRAYALYFLAQFGPAYDVFPPLPPPVVAAPLSGLRPL